MSSTVPGSSEASCLLTAAVSDKQYYVFVGGPPGMAIATTAGEQVSGVLQDGGDIAAGSPGNFVLHGRTLVRADGAIAQKQKVQVSSTALRIGWVKPLLANTEESCGYAIAPAADGDVFELFFAPEMGLNSFAAAT